MFKKVFWIVILINYAAINYCVFMGSHTADISFLFQERQAITFLSALQLAFTSFLAMSVYVMGGIIHKKNPRRRKEIKLWIISAFVFAFCTIDEYFMMHEGIDGDIATAFFGITENPGLDGLTLLVIYGLVGLVLFFKFKNEILRYKDALLLFCAAGFFFVASSLLDLKTTYEFRILLEETSKLSAVAFLLLGHAYVFGENVKALDKRVNP